MGYGKYEICGYCRYCITENAREVVLNGKFHCDRENIWVFANARPIKSNCFWQRPGYQLSGCDEAISISEKFQRFYISTTIFKMLGLGETKELNMLYAFRHNYLDSSESTKGFMEDYDIFGPIIASMLETIDKGNTLVQRLYDFYILGTLKLINAGDLEGASELYESMYARLKQDLIIAPLEPKNQNSPHLNSAFSY